MNLSQQVKLGPFNLGPITAKIILLAGYWLCAYNRINNNDHMAPAMTLQHYALVAQLDRALPSEGRGQRFESSRVRHFL